MIYPFLISDGISYCHGWWPLYGEKDIGSVKTRTWLGRNKSDDDVPSFVHLSWPMTFLQPAIKYLFSSCKAKKMSIKLNESQHVQRCFSWGDTLGMWGIMAENRLSMRIPASGCSCSTLWYTNIALDKPLGFLPTHQLVGGFKPSWQILVNGKIIPYIVENKACSKPPTSQIQGGKEVTWPNFNSLQPWVWLVQSP